MPELELLGASTLAMADNPFWFLPDGTQVK